MSDVLDRFTAMGCEIVVAGAGPGELAAIRWLFRERDRRFSRFLPDSELNRVNGAAGSPVVVSPAFAGMTRLALWAAAETDGLVDPTLGGALLAAGYDRDFDQIPERPEAPAPGARGCWRGVALQGRALRVPRGAVLDLNGVVKSSTVDDALGLLPGAGWVSAGGDMAARGGVGVALPGGDAVQLIAGGIATSGRGRRTWRSGGVAQHHLIDPGTGAPSRSPWDQVTVSGSTCIDADVAAKAAFLLGETGPAWLDERGMPGRFMRADGGVVVNEAWRAALTGGDPVQVACT
jgi:FAD:protein FMN transferase